MAKLGGGGWLKKLFGGAQNSDHETEEAVHDAGLSQTAEPAASAQLEQKPDEEEESMTMEVEGGAMLRVWQLWQGEDSPPPRLSLMGRGQQKDLPLSGNNAVSREKLRLRAQLEKDARERMRVVDARKPDQDLDGQCRVSLSRFGMVAWIFVFPPVGETGQVIMESLAKALQSSGVTSGIDTAALLRLVSEKKYFDLIPVACGTAPIEGRDGYVEELFPREVKHEIQVDENGTADYRSLTYVQMIQKGEAICDIYPPEEGQAGLRVDGKIMETKRVRPAKIPAGSNTEMSEDGEHLIASIDGHLVYSNGVFLVRPLLEVPGDVDYSTGNIDFRGDVHVHGDVRENFFVRATGTVTIDGTVEAANIEAGGDIVVSCGVLGDNRATIKSGGCVRVKYLESCVTYAAQGVYADCIVSAQVNSDDIISVTTGRGTVIGGTLTAGNKIVARMIGSQSGMKTALVLGVMPYNQEKLRNEQADLRGVSREMEELTKNLERMEAQEDQGLQGMDEKLAKARLRRSVLSMKIDKLRKDQQQIQPVVPDLTKCRVECDIMYPGTSLKVEDAVWKTDDIRRACKLTYDEMTASIWDA
jgi:uncharacterized protein (DUF342 family)